MPKQAFVPKRLNTQGRAFRVSKDIEQIRKSKETILVKKREINLAKMNKWEEFRHRRTKVIDEYIQKRKIQYKAEQLITFIKRTQMIKQIFSEVMLQKKIYQERIMAHFLNVTIAKRWLKGRRYFGPSLLARQNKEMMYKFSFIGLISKRTVDYRAKKILREFLDDFYHF